MKNHHSFKVFIVEDDVWYGSMLQHYLSLNPEYEVKRFESPKDFFAQLHENPEVVTLDYSLPDCDGAEVLKKIKEHNPDIRVIVIFGQEDVATAINLLKNGAFDYIVKDDDTKDRLWNSILHLREISNLKQEVETLKSQVGRKYDFSQMILGKSDQIQKVFSLIEKAAKTNITVSVTGETGSGKEMIAKAIHYNSDRHKLPFVAVNVAAIPRDLIESELFGHEKGAFTGAVTRRIGSNTVTKIDARIIVATHKNLLEEVKNKNFREDLYYRLIGLPISLPPLRERGNDILILSKHFIDGFCRENKMEKKSLSPEASQKLLQYPFPGNVRELKSVVELSVVMADEEMIQAEHITLNTSASIADLLNKEMTLKEFEIQILQHYLDKYDKDVLLVAKKLDVGKSTLYRMIQN